MQGAWLVLPAGSLDDDGALDLRPNAHIFFASRAQWEERLEDIAKIDGLPGQA